MKNIEKYAKEILGFASSVGDRIAVRKTTMKPCECSDNSFKCEECLRYVDSCCEDEALYKWAMAEYVEQKYRFELAESETGKGTNIPHGWIPISERLPEDENYILVSFENCTMEDIARYEEDEDGGAFYPGDDEKPYSS